MEDLNNQRNYSNGLKRRELKGRSRSLEDLDRLWKEPLEKRGLRECRLLENLNKMVQEANEQMLPSNLEEMSQKLSDISKRLEAANHMAERVQQRELEAQQNTGLQANMEKLKEDWAEFVKEQQRLKEEVDEEHAKAVGELSSRFSEKKKDLVQFSL
ncbi:biogenesis of lysosome-related organelles complex 1 subunit 5 isoform X1 [Fundulus heteroclitus]|uniref:biogenesis of lysosome-related organelles complex 1 subunit 5 isoform X1 n=1 Tax=Fundulus heteroclitus TaxID=8078 RepID=UPI00165AD130|nr:biogenesis of lysosome-related organelles complex 1 subunit 5 isoform X1 [Fundulus heteroclitus]XP_035981102.1 biogenesis of lysosome-related organelles complex 1 subunit 5 isoform X1 [Fundulus heteroclitus]